MNHCTTPELVDARGAIQSSIRKIEKSLETLLKKDPPPKSQVTLTKRNLQALRLALSLIEREIEEAGGKDGGMQYDLRKY